MGTNNQYQPIMMHLQQHSLRIAGHFFSSRHGCGKSYDPLDLGVSRSMSCHKENPGWLRTGFPVRWSSQIYIYIKGTVGFHPLQSSSNKYQQGVLNTAQLDIFTGQIPCTFASRSDESFSERIWVSGRFTSMSSAKWSQLSSRQKK